MIEYPRYLSAAGKRVAAFPDFSVFMTFFKEWARRAAPVCQIMAHINHMVPKAKAALKEAAPVLLTGLSDNASCQSYGAEAKASFEESDCSRWTTAVDCFRG